MIPRVPGEVGLSLPGNQSPIECTNVMCLRNWQDVLNGAAQGPSQVLGAQDRPSLRVELRDAGLKVGRPAVAVERDDVGVVELNAADRAAEFGVRPLAVPHPTRQWLTGINRACP